MSTMLIQSGTLDDIADAIRAKTGKVASMTPLEMPDEIESISGGSSGLPILSGTSNPTSSQGTNGQEYLKYVNYIYKSFFNGTVIIRENEDDATDIKLFVNGFSRENTDLVPITDSDLLAYLTDITTGKFKGCDVYNNDQSTQYAFILVNQSGNMYINVANSAVSQRVSGTFYGGMIDLSQPSVSSATNYQTNGYKTCDTNIDEFVTNSFIKKNGVWQDLLENTDIDDIILSVGGVTKKKSLIISNDINASTLLEQVVDENLEVTNVFAGTYNSEVNAYQTDLIKFFYDTVGTYGHQYYWHVIAKTDVTCNGIDYVAGDIIDYWYYDVKKTLLVEEA